MSSDLEVRRETLPAPRGGPLVPGEWEQLSRIAKTIAGTEFVPKGLRGNGHAVMAAILYGRDQGLSPMVALSEIHMVDGKPTMSAALIAGKVRLAGHRVWREAVEDGQGHIVGMTAHGERTDGTRDSFTFTLDMARRAGLAGKNNWKSYPEAMLWARAVTQLARMLFSDVFTGSVYTADEMGADTDEDGAVLHGEIVDESSAGEPQADAPSPVSEAVGNEPPSPAAPVPEEEHANAPDGPEPSVSGGAVTPPASSGSPFQQPGSVPLDPRNSPCVLFDGRTSQARTLKKLDITVTQGRDEGLFDTLTVHAVAFELAADLIGPASEYVDDTGEVRYSLLRKVLPMWLASQMIDKLEVQADFARLAS